MAKEKNNNFAKLFRRHIRQSGKSQKQIAKELGLSESKISHLCMYGTGKDEDICSVLNHLGFSARQRCQMLKQFHRENAKDPILRETWEADTKASPNVADYLKELSPIPLDRLFCCSYHGISFRDIIDCCRKIGLSENNEFDKVTPAQFMELRSSLIEIYGLQKVDIIFSPELDRDYPSVIYRDIEDETDAATQPGMKLERCKGKLLFGIPHLVICRYTFGDRGIVHSHRHRKGGVEFVHSDKGTFALDYEGKTYPLKLKPRRGIFIFDGRQNHSLRLISRAPGRLTTIRFCPDIRFPKAYRERNKKTNPRTRV